MAATRSVLGWVAAAMLGVLLVSPGAIRAEEIIRSHGMNFYGELSYPEGFAHFDYVNPDAPKGGELVLGTTGTFDSLNPYSRKGRAGALTTLQYDRMIVPSADGVGEYYGLLAESIEYPESKDWVIFRLRPEARFWDGSPVTAQDVVYSHRLFIEQGLPSYAVAVGAMVTAAEALDDRTVRFSFNPDLTKRSRIETVGSTPVFSRAWFEADPENRRLDEPRMEVALGSGPYRLAEYDVNRRIVYERVPDYWAADLPVNRGRHNYDAIRVEYFADATAAFEAFKAGEYLFRTEGDPKRWATGYDFRRVSDGTIVLEELPDGSPPDATGFVFNLGRPWLQDLRVREAIARAFNFEWANETLLYGLYAPRHSFSEGTHIEATGLPEGDELALLESLGSVVPAEIMTEPARVLPSSAAGRVADRRNLRGAAALLEEAGWITGDDGLVRNADGQTLRLNMLIPTNIEPTVEAMHEAFVQNLRQIGVDARFETVDPSQYTLRQRERDYDMLYSTRYSSLLTTGGGLTQMYGSAEAAFSLFNPAGLASPAVDAIIDASLAAETREATDIALSALDRAMRHELFVVPVGYIPDVWVAYYDLYRHPETLPRFDVASSHIDLWWVDPEKAQALKDAGVID
jgi:microcin C transport system substrate-binding protein